MNSISVSKICEITGGTILEGSTLSMEEQLKTEVVSVVMSSKEGAAGTLFVPIIGERADAHDYIGDAYAHGSRVTFTSRDKRAEGTEDCVYIRVADTKKALQDLGTYYRECFKGKVIGITGSVGKTTTKEMLAQALSAGYKVLKTAGNKNSQLGVPMMMLELDNEKYNLATFEMGMSEFGEMERLAQIAKPSYALVTNIGVAHIAQLGSQLNIRSEKLRITDCFPEKGGILFVNGEDPLLKDLTGVLPADKEIKVMTFGLSDESDFYAKDIKVTGTCTDFVFVDKASGEHFDIFLPVIGTHNIIDAVAAVGVAKTFGLDIEAVKKSIAEYCPINMRGAIEDINGITLIDDTYNASPDSMKSGLNMLDCMENKGRKIVVFADVLELGSFSEQLHREVGAYAAGKAIDKLIAVGNDAKFIAEEAKKILSYAENNDKNTRAKNSETGKANNSENSNANNGNANAAMSVVYYEDKALVFEKELSDLKKGDIVYMKGSRGMRLDILAENIRTSYR